MVQHRENVKAAFTIAELAALANELALRCPPSETAFSVGAVIATPEGRILGQGYSRETGSAEHAEEAALASARDAGHDAAGAHAFVSLEPCGRRRSKPRGCAALLIEAGIERVYFTAREPSLFVTQDGLTALEEAGVACIRLDGFEDMFQRANAHLLARAPRPGKP